MSRHIRIDPISLTSLRVVPKFNELELGSATAFLLERDGKHYLITNWHVLSGRNPDTEACLDKKYAALPTSLLVRFHARAQLGTWTSLELPLINPEGTRTWLEHPLGRKIDVAAIELSTQIAAAINIYSLDLELADVDMLVVPATPVSVVGYPLGTSAGESWPIWKTGHIASDPDIDFQAGKPAFLIDATTRSGMSGSPVILRLGSFSKSDGTQVLGLGLATKFLGIYSGRVHEDSEIGQVWRPFVLLELLQRRLIFDKSTGRDLPRRMVQCPCGSRQRFKSCCGSAP